MLRYVGLVQMTAASTLTSIAKPVQQPAANVQKHVTIYTSGCVHGGFYELNAISIRIKA